MGKFAALLRGINVSGRNKVPMAELRPLCETLGWRDVQTYIQSGNAAFEAEGKAAAMEAALEQAIEARFGFPIPVLVRSARAWVSLVAANPFPEASEAEPNRVLLALSKAALKADTAAALQSRAVDGEKVRQAGGALWIHYPSGVGTSKLSPSLIDRLAGSSVTARNWRTVLKLREMLG